MALEVCELDKLTVTTDKSLSEGSNQLANRPHCVHAGHLAGAGTQVENSCYEKNDP